jgi:hypothetical protein
MTKSEILNIVLTIDTSTVKGFAGVGILTLIDPMRVLGVMLGLVLVIMSIIEKYYAIKKSKKP